MSRMRGMGIKAAKGNMCTGDVFGYNNETACVCVCEGDGYIQLNMEGERERAPFLVSLMLGARSQS